MYFTPRSPISVLSSSTSANANPPSSSPTCSSSIIPLTNGFTAWQVVHQLALHIVIKGRLFAAESIVSVCRSFGVRTLSKMRFWFDRADELKRMGRWACAEGMWSFGDRRSNRAGRWIIVEVRFPKLKSQWVPPELGCDATRAAAR